VNPFEARDDLIRRITALDDRYNVEAEVSTETVKKVAGRGGIGGRIYGLGFVAALTLEAAEVHATVCVGGCRSCELFSTILAVNLELARQDINSELARKMRDGTP
jgi:hypothetical protein